MRCLDLDATADMFVSCRAKANQKGRQRQCARARVRKTDSVCARMSECMCPPVLGVVREMSQLLRVRETNLWESCTHQHTHTDGKRNVEEIMWSGDMILIPPVKLIIPSIDSQHKNNPLYSHRKLSEVIKAANEVRMGHYKASKHESFYLLAPPCTETKDARCLLVNYGAILEICNKATDNGFHLFLTGPQIPEL